MVALINRIALEDLTPIRRNIRADLFSAIFLLAEGDGVTTLRLIRRAARLLERDVAEADAESAFRADYIEGLGLDVADPAVDLSTAPF